jgi:hypothetical protein
MADINNIINKYWTFILGFIILNYAYLYLDVQKNKSINSLIHFYGSFGFLLTIINMYMSINYQTADTVKTQINYYNSLFDTLNNNIYNFFRQYNDLKYYYDELFYGISNYDEAKRNKYLEQLVTFQILSDIDSFVNYIDSFKILNKNTNLLFITEEKLKTILKLFFKSKIFLEHWNYFRKNLALKWTKDYIDLYIDY